MPALFLPLQALNPNLSCFRSVTASQPQSDEIRRSSNLPFSTSPRFDLTAGVYHPDTSKRAVQQLGNLHPGNGESARGTLVLTCFCAASGWSGESMLWHVSEDTHI